MNPHRLALAALLAFLPACSSTSSGSQKQTSPGSATFDLAGRVSDDQGRPIPKVDITIQTTRRQSANTPGAYTVSTTDREQAKDDGSFAVTVSDALITS